MITTRLMVVGAGILASASVLAEVPVFHQNKLKLNEVATYQNSQARYYQNVELAMDPDGRLRIVKADVRPLAVVDELEVTLFEGPAASVYASGNLSIPCVALEPPAVLREDSRFVVILAETTMEPGEVCMSFAAVTPFGISVPLPLDGLPAGEYEVMVNSKITSFVLTQDQL